MANIQINETSRRQIPMQHNSMHSQTGNGKVKSEPVLLWLCFLQLPFENAWWSNHDFLHLVLLCTAETRPEK